MKISFGRIIPIKSVTNPSSENQRKRVDNSTFEVARVLNSEKSTNYSKEEATSIRLFFRDILGDYNGKNGILIRRNEDGDLFLISGEDAKKLEKREKIKGYVEFKAENGKQKKKKDTEIIFSSSQILPEEQIPTKKPIKAKIDRFQYLNTKRYFTAQADGFIRKDIEQTSSPTYENRCENIIVDYKELCL